MDIHQRKISLSSPSGRVILATPSAAEDEATSLLRVEPAIRRYLQFLPATLTTEEVRERRESRAKNPQIMDLNVFFRNEDGTYELGGSTGIFHIDDVMKSCETGILVSSKYQGQGFTAEVFYVLFSYVLEEKGFHRIYMETSMQNAPMRGWLENVAGMRLEGVKKEMWTDNAGGWIDVASYAMLNWEWRDRVKALLERRIALLGQGKFTQ